MRYIHFIVNPISGKGTHNITLNHLKNFFPETDFKIAIDYTKYKGHAIDLAKMALALNASCIVACGG
ncbi:MAG: diacylglycerol kinase family protein, partial [Bacteroidota bacterium]